MNGGGGGGGRGACTWYSPVFSSRPAFCIPSYELKTWLNGWHTLVLLDFAALEGSELLQPSCSSTCSSGCWWLWRATYWLSWLLPAETMRIRANATWSWLFTSHRLELIVSEQEHLHGFPLPLLVLHNMPSKVLSVNWLLLRHLAELSCFVSSIDSFDTG